METVKLSRIVMKFSPEWYPFLRKHELNLEIVLRDGLDYLEEQDAREIIQLSISQYQKDALLH